MWIKQEIKIKRWKLIKQNEETLGILGDIQGVNKWIKVTFYLKLFINENLSDWKYFFLSQVVILLFFNWTIIILLQN